MRNSKTSYTVNVSKDYHIDAVNISNSTTFGAAAADTIVNSAAVCFQRSKLMGRNNGAYTNEGIVHKLLRMWVEYVIVGTVAGQAGARSTFQIDRRDPGAGAPDVLLANTPVDHIAFEDTVSDQVWQESRSTAASQVFREPCQNKIIHEFPCPLIFVQPYYLKVRSIMSSAVAQTLTASLTMYMQVESVRVKGAEYRRLLDHYTQLPSTIERQGS